MPSGGNWNLVLGLIWVLIWILLLPLRMAACDSQPLEANSPTPALAQDGRLAALTFAAPRAVWLNI